MSANPTSRPLVVRGTEILATDPSRIRLQKLARITLDSMVQFVGLLDAAGTVLEINKVALDAVGIKLSDVEGKPFWTTFWWQVSWEINQTLRESIKRAALGELVRWDAEIYGRAGGKETIIIDASLCPVMDDAGNVVFICAEGRDITEKKAQEREIAQKNIELQGLLERIRELDEIKTQFFANVSHELRTPLALILGPAQRLIDDDGTQALQERRESAEVIVRSARMLLKHVNDLLDISKLEAGKLKIELVDTDVAALVRFLASHFSVLAAERGIDYAVDADETCLAAVDADKLQRVLMNLLANAFKFVPAGGRVRCTLKTSPRELTLSVDDSGPGVEPNLRRAIFERFRQGDGGINRRVGGTGLGLAIAQEFVEMHKGRIEVLDSELGGATFQVTIPLNRLSADPGAPIAPAASIDRALLSGLIHELQPADTQRPRAAAHERDARAPVSASAPNKQRPRVLVVEDNLDMNRFIQQCLERDYEVICAFDGREGLEKALHLRPMLVVSDIMMPHVSGVEMIEQMRKLPELRELPILLLSAKADEELMVKLLDEGAHDFIVKPFSEKDLLVRVRNLVVTLQAREQTALALTREQQVRAQAELHKQRLHALFMQAPTLIAVLRGPEHVVELANPPICQVWGHAEDELLGRPLFEVMPELRDQVLPALDDVYRSGTPHVSRETPATFLRADGTTEMLYLNFVYAPLRNVDAELEGVFMIASDVTAQVLARTQVDGLRDAAESANRAKDEFLAMLGHELRNPLSPIVTALQLMKVQGPEHSEHARTIIERQVDHLIRLVDDLLDVSRIARGKVELKKETIEIAEIVATAIEMVSPLLEERAHFLHVDVPRHGLAVDGDPMRLSQVVSNLLTNAAKYTPPAGRITLRAQRAGEQLVLSVRDSGIGISADVLQHVFDLFVQERQAIDRSQGGLGLGLAIVRNLVEGHGGSVSAASEGAGRGSEFTVRLPLSATVRESAPAPAAGDVEDATSGPQGRRVLVVDDNEDGAALFAELLERKGYAVRVAHEGPSALRVAEEFLPNIALLDIGLPVMDGYELARRLREIPGLSALQLIALTGYGQESDRRKSLAAGFQQHLVKPVSTEALVGAMSRL
jgi:PAS domain S-box-containing protein